jgi:hypothetical protein
VAADGGIAFVEDRPRGEQRLGAAEQLLDALQFTVAAHRLERIEGGAGPQHEDAVEARVLGHLRLVNGRHRRARSSRLNFFFRL